MGGGPHEAAARGKMTDGQNLYQYSVLAQGAIQGPEQPNPRRAIVLGTLRVLVVAQE
jgi:hypothetical protein